MVVPAAARLALVTFFGLYAVGFTIRLCNNLAQHPLFSPPDRPGDWDRQWLITTVFDFYGVALVLGATIAMHAKATTPSLITTTSIMLGFGETDDQIRETRRLLREPNGEGVTFGQYILIFFGMRLYPALRGYMQPTKRHKKVFEHVTPEKFATWQTTAEAMGFLYCASGPLVRSSYKAGEFFLKGVLEKRRRGEALGTWKAAEAQ